MGMTGARRPRQPLPLSSLNHISRNCLDIHASVAFYEDVLGFIQIVRPQSPPFNFDGAWLFQYGVGLHLLKEETAEGIAELKRAKAQGIDPRADHISFQADNTGVVEQRLQEYGIVYRKQAVVEGNIRVQQIFFHDPDGHMIEICDCEALPIIPLSGGEGAACPFSYRKVPLIGQEVTMTEESMLKETIASAIGIERKLGVQASGQVPLPSIGSYNDLSTEGLFPVCA